jgi:glycosyltransferase involved in cell wall biosynthesis
MFLMPPSVTSIIIPCLNEEGSLEECIRLVREAFANEQQAGALEILVVDNGSSDRSVEIATKAGVRVVHEKKRGYGAALMRGLLEATGDFLVLGDADNTYDWRDGAKLVESLKEGSDFAIGDRINGEVEPGAMPWMHQKIGTPILTSILNMFFGSRIKDINCGLRAIRKTSVPALQLRSPGMEFASEMVIHAQKAGLKISEIPIRYYKRRAGEAKLRTFRDGWRHLRFILLCAPFPLYVVPAFFLLGAGIIFFLSSPLGYVVLGSGFLLVGLQIFLFGLMAKAILWLNESFLVDRPSGRKLEKFQLEHGIIFSLFLAALGLYFLFQIDIRSLIRGATLVAIAMQTFFASFLLSTLLLKKREVISFSNPA